MKITDIMKEHTSFSFEVFPPKTDKGVESLLAEGGVLDHLYEMQPDYISCTYGAGGSNAKTNLEVLKAVKAKGNAVPVAHFTCIGNTKAEIREQLDTYLANGIDHLLCLRGDLPYGWTGTGGDLHYATELVRFVRDEYGDKFTIAVSGSPEGHIACRSLEADIGFLKQKQDEGADYIMTQLCWDLDQFARWYEMIRKAGITLPVDVGIMPVLNPAATLNMALSHNGCVVPHDLACLISKHWIFPNPFAPEEAPESVAQKLADFKKAGIEYTVRQIDQYRMFDVAGLHFYALNAYEDVRTLIDAAGLRDVHEG